MKAFPSSDAVNAGMDLRDYFAAKAMQSLMEKFDDPRWEIAADAYLFADAMMEARKQ